MKCNVSFSFLGIALLTLMLIYDKSGNAVHGICAAVFHESGHIFLLLLLRDIPEKIRVSVYGIRIERSEKVNISYFFETLIVLAGPLFNILTALVMSFFEKDMSVPIKMNLALAFFNLLPLSPLDGGRALFYILCRIKNETFAKTAIKIITVLGIIPLTVTGIIIFIYDKSSYSLLLSSVYISFSLLSFP